jgi:hypothetical protein
MDEVSLRVELNTVSESRPWTDQGEETLLAAALAATLVKGMSTQARMAQMPTGGSWLAWSSCGDRHEVQGDG